MAIRKFLNKYWGWTFLLIPLALQAIFFYFPMVQGAFYSLTNWTGLTYNYKFVGLNNYKLLMIDGKFFTAIAFTYSGIDYWRDYDWGGCGTSLKFEDEGADLL